MDILYFKVFFFQSCTMMINQRIFKGYPIKLGYQSSEMGISSWESWEYDGVNMSCSKNSSVFKAHQGEPRCTQVIFIYLFLDIGISLISYDFIGIVFWSS